MLAQMTSGQLDEWIAANELDQQIGLEKLYAMLAVIASTMCNLWGGKTEPEMFIPQYETKRGGRSRESPEKQTVSPNMMAAMAKLAFKI